LKIPNPEQQGYLEEPTRLSKLICREPWEVVETKTLAGILPNGNL
jgi:hypothetical protein